MASLTRSSAAPHDDSDGPAAAESAWGLPLSMLFCSQRRNFIRSYPLPADAHGNPHSPLRLTPPFRKVRAPAFDLCSYISDAKALLSSLSTNKSEAKTNFFSPAHSPVSLPALSAHMMLTLQFTAFLQNNHTISTCNALHVERLQTSLNMWAVPYLAKLEFNFFSKKLSSTFSKSVIGYLHSSPKSL